MNLALILKLVNLALILKLVNLFLKLNNFYMPIAPDCAIV
jgi:hypothetical protein